MATLTQVSAITRKGLKITGLVLVILMMIPIVYRTVSKWWITRNPPPPAAPTVVYGRLPLLDFSEPFPGSQPKYKLETISGNLPTNLDTVGRVYVVGINRSRLVSLDRIRGMARTLGFTTDVGQLDEQNYIFVHQNLPAELRFNIITWQFSYRYDWTSDPEVYLPKTRNPQVNQAIGEARSYFTKIGLLSSDLAEGSARHQYLIATNSAMVPTQSFYDSNFTKVDIFRTDKDNWRVLTPGGDVNSPVNIILGGIGESKRVLQANYYYSMTVDNDFATYPLITVGQAYDQLVNGKGYIAKKAGADVTIRKASLAYYESAEPQKFLQPIFVFEGDGNFMAYVQAVRPDYLDIPQPTPTLIPAESSIPTQ